MRGQKKGGGCPHFLIPNPDLFLVFALAFELFQLAALALDFQLVLIDLLVLISGLIIATLQLIADQSACAQT